VSGVEFGSGKKDALQEPLPVLAGLSGGTF
jgi:hypothetical protein